MNAALGGSFGSSTGASYSQDAEDKRKKVKVTALKLLLINTTAVDLILT